MLPHSKHWQRGEIATTLTLIGVTVMAIGAIVGANLTRNQDIRSRAADFGSAVLQCDGGVDPYNSNTIVITNNTDQVIEEMDTNVFRCPYEPGRIRKGYYKCEDDCTGDGPDCQEGYWDPGYSQVIENLQPGQSVTRTVQVNPCEIVQLDAYNKEVYQDDSQYECTNVQSQHTVPAGNRWYGGIAFAIKENPNCSTGFQQPDGSAPLGSKLSGSNPPPVCTTFTSITQAEQNCQPNGIEPVSGISSCWKCKAAPVCTGFSSITQAEQNCSPTGIEAVPGIAACWRCKAAPTAPVCTTPLKTRSQASLNCGGEDKYESVPGFTGNCFRCKTTSTCTTSLKSVQQAEANCGTSGYEAVPGISSCYRCKATPPVCNNFKTTSQCEVNCSAGCEPVSGISSCFRCKPTIPLQSPISQPQSLDQISGRRGFQFSSTEGGYVFFEGQGQLYAVPYMLPENEQNLFRVL